MALTISEAEIREVVSQVLNKVQSAPAAKGWDSTQYAGRKLVGIYEDMNDAIAAASEGYKAKASCLNGIDSVRRNVIDALIIEPEAE